MYRTVPFLLCSYAGLARQGEGEHLGLWLQVAVKLHECKLDDVMADFTFIPAHSLVPGRFALKG